MKNQLLFFILLCSFLFKSYSQCQNLISNPEFIDTLANFATNINGVNVCREWLPSHGTPTFSFVTNRTSRGNGSALMWCSLTGAAGSPMVGEGVLGPTPTLQVNKPYLFSMMAANLTANNGAIPLIRADFSNLSRNSNTQLPAYTSGVTVQPILNRTSFTSTAFTACQTCITPTQAWNNVWIHPETNIPNTLPWVAIDDVELVPNFDFAGPDKSICEGESTRIGEICNYLNLRFTYRWSILGSGGFVGNNIYLDVSPTKTTTFVLMRRPVGAALSGCLAFDTVVVKVHPPPDKPCLGPDTFLCKPDCYTINNPYELCLPGLDPSAYDYTLNGISAAQIVFPLTICESGAYILCAKYKGGGTCESCDTINIKFHPEIPHRDTILYYCSNDFPKTICTFNGYRYSWSTGIPGDTLRCLSITKAGKYIVTLTDSFGCQTKDTFNIKLKAPPYINLPKDTTLCHGSGIILDGGVGMKSYSWSTGETTRKILVTASGRYIVSVMSHDSCYDTDTIDVVIRDCPIFTNLNYGPYCANDECITLNVLPKLGSSYSYSGSGILPPNKFCPKIAGCGYHKINYRFVDSFGCVCDTSFFIYVKCITPPKIDGVGPLCIDDLPQPLNGYPSGGVFTGSGVFGGKFYPNLAGAGWHWIKYCYTDSSGCNACDSIKINVIKINASIVVDGDTASLCDNEPVKLTARGGNKFYWVQSGSTDSFIYVTKSGAYCVIVSDDKAGCPDTVCITINLRNCCTESMYTDPFNSPGGIVFIGPGSPYATFSNMNLVITGTVHILPGATWTLNNCKVLFKECARVIIDRNDASVSLPAAKMFVYNSKLLGCKWKGIEVWGVYDDCNADTTDNTIPGSGMIQGKLTMVNSTITDADMAIFVGRRVDATLGLQNWEYYAGGVIDIQGCHFYHNYADIVFSEYNVYNIACLLNCVNVHGFGSTLASKIENNYFDTLKPLEECDTFLNYYFDRYLPTPHINPWRCHIINFTDNPVFTKGPPVGFPPVYLQVCLDLEKAPNPVFDCDFDIRNNFNHNRYIDPCPSNLNFKPGCYQINNGYK